MQSLNKKNPVLSLARCVPVLSFCFATALYAVEEVPFVDFIKQGNPIIPRSEAKLIRHADEVEIIGETYKLTPGYAYTVWAVVFNQPDACMDGCGLDDVVEGRGDPAVMWAGAGFIADDDGEGKFDTVIEEGNPPGEVFRQPSGMGLVDAENAEIHLIIRCHGPVSDDTVELLAQLTTFGGGCPCEDVQAAALPPAGN